MLKTLIRTRLRAAATVAGAVAILGGGTALATGSVMPSTPASSTDTGVSPVVVSPGTGTTHTNQAPNSAPTADSTQSPEASDSPEPSDSPDVTGTPPACATASPDATPEGESGDNGASTSNDGADTDHGCGEFFSARARASHGQEHGDQGGDDQGGDH